MMDIKPKPCCERCGGEYEMIITPCMSKLCIICTDYLLGPKRKLNYKFYGVKEE